MPTIRVFCQCLQKSQGPIFGYCMIKHSRISRWLCEVLLLHVVWGTLKGGTSCQQLIDYTVKGILITFRRGPALNLFRSHICGSPCSPPDFFAPLHAYISHDLCNTEIGKQCFPWDIEKNIFRFKITMNNLLFMYILKSLSDLREN